MDTYQATVTSNIAFLKYWGKDSLEHQWPSGNSLSMTLSKACSVTKAAVIEGESDHITFAASSGLKKSASEDHKITAHLDRVRKELRVPHRFKIETHNTFPSSCGIASSASGFGALTLACVAASLQCDSLDLICSKGYARERLAHLARMGSGSASRSFFGGYVSWYRGQTPDKQSIKQEFTSEHMNLADLIVVLSSENKSVSSTQAHAAAPTSQLYAPRIAGLTERHKLMLEAIKTRDFSALGRLIEVDALEMHAVIMTSNPPINYWHEKTSSLVAWLRQMRQTGHFEAYATIDAGPNVHVICRPEDMNKIKQQISEHFSVETFIEDRVGAGPQIKRLGTLET